jgi:hypothetical protein
VCVCTYTHVPWVVSGVSLAIGLLKISIEVNIRIEASNVGVKLLVQIQDQLLLIIALVSWIHAQQRCFDTHTHVNTRSTALRSH